MSGPKRHAGSHSGYHKRASRKKITKDLMTLRIPEMTVTIETDSKDKKFWFWRRRPIIKTAIVIGTVLNMILPSLLDLAGEAS